jgi:hypothetical protein
MRSYHSWCVQPNKEIDDKCWIPLNGNFIRQHYGGVAKEMIENVSTDSHQ